MWKQLPADKIDQEAWDDCVDQDPDSRVYALAWYLQVVAPGWEGWVLEGQNSYLAVVPVVKRSLLGIRVITQPLLTQQLGLFTRLPDRRAQYWNEVSAFIFNGQTPIEQYNCKSSDLAIVQSVLSVSQRSNFILPLNADYFSLQANYALNRRRDLKKAIRSRLQIRRGWENWDALFTLYRQSVLPRLPQNQQTKLLKLIPQLAEVAGQKSMAQIYTVFLPNGQIVAGAWFLYYSTRLTYLLPASSEVGKNCGATTYLLDQVCQQYAGTATVLDFEGSSKPGIARFFKSFGAYPEQYAMLTNFNFPLPVKILFNFKKLWRQVIAVFHTSH